MILSKEELDKGFYVGTLFKGYDSDLNEYSSVVFGLYRDSVKYDFKMDRYNLEFYTVTEEKELFYGDLSGLLLTDGNLEAYANMLEHYGLSKVVKGSALYNMITLLSDRSSHFSCRSEKGKVAIQYEINYDTVEFYFDLEGNLIGMF